MPVYNSWSPTADAAQSSPADFDLNHPVWMNEVMTAQHSSLFVTRTVKNATPTFASGNKEADFVITGSLGVQRFNKGDEKRGSDRKQIKRTLGLNDRPYYAAIEDEKLTRMFEQVATRSPLTESFGHALGAHTEVETMRRLATAARFQNTSYAPSEFRDGGNFYVGDNSGSGIVKDYAISQTGAKNVLAAIEEASLAWTKLNVKLSNRWLFLDPALWYELHKLEVPWDGAAVSVAGGIYGNADIVGPKMAFTENFNVMQPLRYRGVDIYAHNLVEADYDTGVSKFRADWTGDPDVAGDFSNTVGVIYQAEAVGHVDLMTTQFKVEEIPRTEIELVSAMKWTGGGTLRCEAAIELVQST